MKTVIHLTAVSATLLSCAIFARAESMKPNADVFFLPLNEQNQSQNVYTPDKTSRCWFYVAETLLSAQETASRINSSAGRFPGTFAFKGDSSNGTALKRIESLTEMTSLTVALWLNYNSNEPSPISTPICAYQGFYLNLEDGSSWGAAPPSDNRRYICFTEFNQIEYGWRSTLPVLKTNEWHHIAVTVERNGAWTKPIVYLDGVEIEMEDNGTIGTPARTQPVSLAGKTLYIGNTYTTDAAGTRPFDGLISDIRIYSSILTPAQIVMLTKSDAELNHRPPTVSISSNAQSGHVTNTVEVTANAISSNPDPDSSLKYFWKQVSGPGQAQFDTQAARSSTVTFSIPGTYILGCTVSDGVYTASESLIELQVDTIGKLPHPDIFFPVRNDSKWSMDDLYFIYLYGSASKIMDPGSGKLPGTRALQLAGLPGECFGLVHKPNAETTPFQADPKFISVAAWVDGAGMANSADNAWLIGKYNVFDVSLYKGAPDTAWPIDNQNNKWYLKFSHGRTDNSGNKGMGFKTWCSVLPKFTAENWQHVTATFCRTNNWNAVPRIWVNGEEVEMTVFANQTTGTLTSLDYLNSTFIIGNNHEKANVGLQYFSGKISDIKILFRELGAGEAKRLAGFVPKQGIILIFK